MAPLEEYRRKRHFDVTPEPAGSSASPTADRFGFVVHKHAARRLHYDLRLEIGGAYASWAIPKGPSLDPAQKRLAVHVEDHPLEYGSFEGTIPADQYGGGTVMVWDQGTFAPLGEPVGMVEVGNLKFVLTGTKLHGTFALVRMKPRPGEKGDNWLLIKERDEFARPLADYDVLAEQPDSAASGRTMEQIAAGEAGSARGAAKPDADAGPVPAQTPFQLATLATEPPEGEQWIHEVKYDGYRLHLVSDRGHARAITRNGLDWSDRFSGLVAAIERLPVTSVLIDGEAVVFDADGRSDFSALQEEMSGKGTSVAFMAFDLLYLDGFDLRDEPLVRRKELLAALLDASPAGSRLRYAEHYSGNGPAFHAAACDMGLEGSVSKRGDRPWLPGRTRDWIKVKCGHAQEFVVGGFTQPAGAREGFGALLLGVHDDRALRYAGKVGSGFSHDELSSLRERLDRIAADASPFSSPPRLAGAHWVRPELVVDVSFREWTRDGVLRQPVYRGLRDDVDPSAVTREQPTAENDATPPAPVAAPAGDELRAPQPGPLVAGVRISNPDKVLQPAGVTKIALARYYEAVAEAMLPHVERRLLTAVRCPSGKGGAGDCFYQRHPEARGWPASLHVTSLPEEGGSKDYFFIDDVQGLIELSQLGVAEIHAWNSLVSDPLHPDRLVFDLDPGDGVTFADVARAAHLLHGVVETLGLSAFVKTTGGRGVHVVVPIEIEHDFDTVRAATLTVCEWLATQAPDVFTAKMSKATRRGRIFIDYLRNARGATAVCAYSVRARPGAPVSVPLAWEELREDLDPGMFGLDSVVARLRSGGAEPWAAYEQSRHRLDVAGISALPPLRAGSE